MSKSIRQRAAAVRRKIKSISRAGVKVRGKYIYGAAAESHLLKMTGRHYPLASAYVRKRKRRRR